MSMAPARDATTIRRWDGLCHALHPALAANKMHKLGQNFTAVGGTLLKENREIRKDCFYDRTANKLVYFLQRLGCLPGSPRAGHRATYWGATGTQDSSPSPLHWPARQAYCAHACRLGVWLDGRRRSRRSGHRPVGVRWRRAIDRRTGARPGGDLSRLAGVPGALDTARSGLYF